VHGATSSSPTQGALPAGAASRPFYDEFGWAYDLLVPHPGGPSAPAVAEMLDASGVSPPASLVDAGCGTGGHALELDRLGFDVTAVDRAPALIEQARRKAGERGSRAHFVVADFLSWRPEKPCDAVLCRGVLNDLVDDRDRREAFLAFAAMLRPGGVLVLDVRDWDASQARYTRNPAHERVVELEGAGTLTFRSETTPDSGSRTLRVRERFLVEFAEQEVDFANDFEMRCWSAPELDALARTAGFRSPELTPNVEGTGARGDRLVAVAVRGPDEAPG
jgi:SAM-dependent methyltransferase